MLLPLFRLATRAALTLRGARGLTHRAGPARLVVYRAGRAGEPPWLLLHGLGSTALSWWRIVPALAPRADLWIPELSALGGSRTPGGGLNVREAVAALGDLLERRVGRPATVAGISLGGWIAARLALERPELVERLVLVDAAGFREQDWERVRRLVTVEGLDDVDRLYGALFHHPPAPMRWARRGFLAAYRSRAVRHVLGTLAPEDALGAEELSRIDVPTTLIWGDHDGLFPLAVARRMAACLPGSELQVIPECGHAVQWEHPRALAEALVRLAEGAAAERPGRPAAAAAPAPDQPA